MKVCPVKLGKPVEEDAQMAVQEERKANDDFKDLGP